MKFKKIEKIELSQEITLAGDLNQGDYFVFKNSNVVWLKLHGRQIIALTSCEFDSIPRYGLSEWIVYRVISFKLIDQN